MKLQTHENKEKPLNNNLFEETLNITCCYYSFFSELDESPPSLPLLLA